MGNIIIKAAKDLDLYCEWSSVVDAPTFIGTRDEVLRHLTGYRSSYGQSDPAEVRVARADKTGTSAKRDPRAPGYTGPLDGEWNDTGFVVEQRGWLPRASMARFLELYAVNVDAAYEVLEPFENDDEDGA